MIVKNEAHCLAQCLDSVASIADELVVGDTGSTDNTPRIASRFGAQVFHVSWENDFAAARNQTIGAATGDWLLHMDADEMLDPDGAARVRRVVDRDGDGADAVEVLLANYCNAPRAWRWTPLPPDAPYAKGFAGCIKTTLLRLFRNHQGYEYREPVHENITASVIEQGGRIRAEDIVIHHYGYEPDGPKAEAKAKTYFAIAKRKWADNPDDVKAMHDYAEQAFACGLADEAERACRAALACDACDLAAGAMMANLLLIRGDFENAEMLLRRLEDANDAPPHIITALAAVTARDGRLDEAMKRLNAVLDAQPGHPMALMLRARVWDRRGRTDLARADLECARARTPAVLEIQSRIEALALRIKGEQAWTHGDGADALRCFAAALRHDREDPLLHNDLGVVLMGMGEKDRAARAFQQALQLAPNLPEPRDNLNHCTPSARP